VKSEELLNQLFKHTVSDSNYVKENLINLSDDRFFYGHGSKQWSAAEIIQHLNLTNIFYIKKIKKIFSKNLNGADYHEELFKSGKLGGYFIKMIKPLPDESMKRKLRAPKKLIPEYSELNKEKVLYEFIENQNSLVELIKKSKKVNLMKMKIPSSATRLLKLNLGDTLSIIVYHNRRHIIQIKKVLANSN